jgi:hypothetical protein
VRNNTPDSTDIRWEVLKSMLDDFPQLRDRTEQYLMGNRKLTKISPTDQTDPGVSRLLRKAVNEYRQKRPRK